MKIFSLLVMAILLAGCGTKIVEKDNYITNTRDVYIPVYCNDEDVTIRCNWKDKDDSGVVKKMMLCIQDLKDSKRFCSKDNMSKYVDELIKKKQADSNTSK